MREVFIAENSKSKILAFLINLFLIFGLLFVPDANYLPHMPDWYNQLDIYLTALLSIPLIWQTKSLLSKTGLKLSAQGIEENMSRWNSQSFPWTDIVTIRLLKIYFLKYILIYIKDPASYMKNQNFYRRITSGSDLRKFGTPIKIPIHSIKKDPKQILDIIVDYTKVVSEKKGPL